MTLGYDFLAISSVIKQRKYYLMVSVNFIRVV